MSIPEPAVIPRSDLEVLRRDGCGGRDWGGICPLDMRGICMCGVRPPSRAEARVVENGRIDVYEAIANAVLDG